VKNLHVSSSLERLEVVAARCYEPYEEFYVNRNNDTSILLNL